MEELIDAKGLVCLNNGQGTRVNFSNGVESAIDLTLVSSELAGASNWEVLKDNIVGGDHYPIAIQFGMNNTVRQDRITRWNFGKVDWGKFTGYCDIEFSKIVMSGQIDVINENIIAAIIKGASQTIKKSTGKNKVKMVPWCILQNLVKYKKAQAIVRKTIKRAKKSYWRGYCSSIGRTTPLDKVWGVIKKMRGIRQDRNLPVLKKG